MWQHKNEKEIKTFILNLLLLRYLWIVVDQKYVDMNHYYMPNNYTQKMYLYPKIYSVRPLLILSSQHSKCKSVHSNQ